MKLVIIDYQMGNLSSIINMFKRIEYRNALITNDIDIIKKADKIILPGVGAFDYGMNNIEKLGLTEILQYKATKEKVPVLGICLGMQLLTNKSEEGEKKGLGLIEAETVKFNFSNKSEMKIPHMGWNYVNVQNDNNILIKSNDLNKFYFVHSYYVKCHYKINVMATTLYGIEFASMIQKENIYGVQFHPEKSHKYGMQLLNNFIKL